MFWERNFMLLRKCAFAALSFGVLVLSIPPWVALIGGIAFALLAGNPFRDVTGKAVSHLLAVAITCLGFGMNLGEVMEAGASGAVYTFISIISVIMLGLLLGRYLASGRNVSWLITLGTAICGGSAIAAIAPVLKAKSEEISIAMAVVFLLNALALLIFPFVGEFFELTQQQFGLWAALAIHDTSSVVGASMQYGPEALEVGTVIKLARALWIVPVAIALSVYISQVESGEEAKPKIKLPWFILAFIAGAALVSYVPVLRPAGEMIEMCGRHILVLALFFVGANFSKDIGGALSASPIIQGVVLWAVVSAVSLWVIALGVI